MDIIYNYKKNKVVGYINGEITIGDVSNAQEVKLLVINTPCPTSDIANYNVNSFWTADVNALTYTKGWTVEEKTIEEKEEYIKLQEEIEERIISTNLPTNNIE